METKLHSDERILEGWKDWIPGFRNRTKAIVPEILENGRKEGRLLFQPRCGVGGHAEMKALLRTLEEKGAPDILSVTIDSYTRLRQFSRASEVLADNPARLNGYPLVSHGEARGRELEACVSAPLEIRHGSPDARRLFATALGSGITSFEGGGIGYNLPYCKDFPLERSLRAWEEIDLVCGRLAEEGVIIDRELFGTLSAVLIPPSVSIALTLLEAILADKAGVKCLSISYPQGGNLVQDVAALRAIRDIAGEYLSSDVGVYPVLHEFMGAFPKEFVHADALILYGAFAAKLGNASKVITKTRHEAHGIPSADVNAEGIRTARLATSRLFDFIRLDESRIEEEKEWILKEVREIVAPILGRGGDLILNIVEAFRDGILDAPFCTSRFARSRIIPMRDAEGAIRYRDFGGLAFSEATRKRNLRLTSAERPVELFDRVSRDIHYFSAGIFAESKGRKNEESNA